MGGWFPDCDGERGGELSDNVDPYRLVLHERAAILEQEQCGVTVEVKVRVRSMGDMQQE